MEKYRVGITRGTKQSVDERTLSQDFLKFVNSWVPRPMPDHKADRMSPATLEMYDELMTKLFVPIYEAGIVNRAPAFQLFQMSKNVDLGRQPDGSGFVDWNTITNQFEIHMVYFTQETQKIILENALLENHSETGQKQLIFRDQDGIESVSFTRVTTPSGVPAWKVEHLMTFKNKTRTMFTVHITEIQM